MTEQAKPAILRGKQGMNPQSRFLLWLLIALVLSVSILAHVPPVSRDALTQHLAVPKIYLQNGKLTELPDIVSSYNPMNLDFLYIIPLYLKHDILAKYIHFLFALLTAYLIYKYLLRAINQTYALLGAVFFLSLPIIVKLSITVYVDLGLIFFSTSALFSFFKWIEFNFSDKYLLLAGVFCGLAMGTKYNGIITFFILSAMIPLMYSRLSLTAHNKELNTLGRGLLFIIISIIIFSPWMVRNSLWTGNPIYPLYESIFNPVIRDAGALPHTGHFWFRHWVYGESWGQILLMPFRIFFQGKDNDLQYFDGQLNAALLILPLFSVLNPLNYPRRIRLETGLLVSFSTLYMLIAFLQTDMRVRYIAPILPPLVILSIFGLKNAVYLVKSIGITWIRKLAPLAIAFGFVAIFFTNANYIIRQFGIVMPFQYLSGKISRDEYIQMFSPEYASIQYANKHTSSEAIILGMFIGHRIYYSDRSILFRDKTLKEMTKNGADEKQMLSVLQKLGVTHMLVRYDVFEDWLSGSFTPPQRALWMRLLKTDMQLLFSKDGYGLYEFEYAANQRLKSP